MGALVLLGVNTEIAPSLGALVWAALAGVSGVLGLGVFYMALARGTMGIVAPLAAVIGAGLPVLVAIYAGEAVSILRLAGIGLALLAVVLISLPGRSRSSTERRSLRTDLRDLPLVLGAGLGFAGFFIGVDQASADGATWWPLVVVRVAGLGIVVAVLGAIVVRRRGQGLRQGAGAALGVERFRSSGRGALTVLPLFVLTGLGDLGGNTFFVLARHADAFSVAVVLSSLYPVITTVLAALLLRERLRPAQLAGVALATLSVPFLR